MPLNITKALHENIDLLQHKICKTKIIMVIALIIYGGTIM